MILEAIGENPDRQGLEATPERIASMYEEFFSGLTKDPGEELKKVVGEDHREMVLIRDIPFFSICEHHLLPFIGKAHVAYIPKNKKVTGLSKLARVVDVLSKRPQLQERLTTQVADTITKVLQPRGVMVVIEAEHLCMTARGVQKPGSITVTSAVRGIFRTKESTRLECMALIRK